MASLFSRTPFSVGIVYEFVLGMRSHSQACYVFGLR